MYPTVHLHGTTLASVKVLLTNFKTWVQKTEGRYQTKVAPATKNINNYLVSMVIKHNGLNKLVSPSVVVIFKTVLMKHPRKRLLKMTYGGVGVSQKMKMISV